jgi:glycosyltransferase involved in cell wall biosynthesis
VHLHIVSFNVPFPADYGGVIDVYYKLKALTEAGVNVHLHCYEYGRKHSEELEKLCFKVYYYQRTSGIKYFMSRKPYIVKTRQNPQLIENLKADNYPILYEGLHTTWPLFCKAFSLDRKQFIRAHNVEHEYYKNLFNIDSMASNKMFFKSESLKLYNYEKVMSLASGIAAISLKDYAYFSDKYKNTIHIPAFHPYDSISSIAGHGEYCLFQGDLSVSENQKAAKFLIKEVFNDLTFPLIIAGKKPPTSLLQLAISKTNIKIIPNPDDDTMQQLLTNAHINILPAYHSSGLKLKLLAALFKGRHCLVNPPIIDGSSLSKLCHIAETPTDFKLNVIQLMQKTFDVEEIQNRQQALLRVYSNTENAKKIINFIFQ